MHKMTVVRTEKIRHLICLGSFLGSFCMDFGTSRYKFKTNTDEMINAYTEANVRLRGR